MPKSKVRKRKNGQRVNKKTLAPNVDRVNNSEFSGMFALPTGTFDDEANAELTARGWVSKRGDEIISGDWWEWGPSVNGGVGAAPTAIYCDSDGFDVEFANNEYENLGEVVKHLKFSDLSELLQEIEAIEAYRYDSKQA